MLVDGLDAPKASACEHRGFESGTLRRSFGHGRRNWHCGFSMRRKRRKGEGVASRRTVHFMVMFPETVLSSIYERIWSKASHKVTRLRERGIIQSDACKHLLLAGGCRTSAYCSDGLVRGCLKGRGYRRMVHPVCKCVNTSTIH